MGEQRKKISLNEHFKLAQKLYDELPWWMKTPGPKQPPQQGEKP